MDKLLSTVIVFQGTEPTLVFGVDDKVQRYLKDLISVGVYSHPIHKWELNVTIEKLQEWQKNFVKMQQNGVDVEVPVDHSLSASDNLGYIKEMFIKGNVLYGIIEVKGKNAIDIIRRNRNVSIWVQPNFKDGKGVEYGEVIKHASVVQQPVVPGQNDFVPIAASGQEIETLYLGSHVMTKEQIDKLRKLLSLGKEITDEQIKDLSAISDAMKSAKDKVDEQSKVLSTLKDENTALKAAKPKTLSIDPTILELCADTMEEKLNLLVVKGKITPDVEKKLSLILLGVRGSRNAMALSLGKDSTASFATSVIEALKDNDAKKLEEQSGAQVLNRVVPDDIVNKADEDGAKAMGLGAGIEVNKK